MVSFTHFSTKIIDLVCRRVVFLFIIAGVLSLVLINHGTLKVKTLNDLLPDPPIIKKFVYHPDQMPAESMRDVIAYYKFLYNIMGNITYEKPAACLMLGYAYYYLGDEKKAIDYLLLSNKIYGHFFWVDYNLGVIAYNDKRYAQALDFFARAKDDYPFTIGFELITRVYKYIGKCLKIKREDFEKSLDDGASYMKQLNNLCAALVQDPDLQKQFQGKKIDLRLF
jgi:tetratricopeptide (TPR) repeat protein